MAEDYSDALSVDDDSISVASTEAEPSILQALAASTNVMEMAASQAARDEERMEAMAAESPSPEHSDKADPTAEPPPLAKLPSLLGGKIQTADQAAKAALRQVTPQQQFRERLTYTLGLANTAMTYFLVGRSARLSALYFAVKLVALIVSRLISWRKRGWHYFLVDLCYIVSLGVVFATAGPTIMYFVTGEGWPAPDWLFRGLWGLAFGPLAWSVAAFTNRAFFHSIDHLGTLSIHVSPSLVMYAVHFEGAQATFGAVGEALVRSYDVADWLLPLDVSSLTALGESAWRLGGEVLRTWGCAMALYMVWLTAYATIIFFIAAPRIKKRGYATLFSFVLNKSNPVGRYFLTLTQDTWLLRLLFIGLHGTFAGVTSLIAALLFHSKALSLAFVIFVGVLAVWNSSSMYMRAVALYLQARAEQKDRADKAKKD